MIEPLSDYIFLEFEKKKETKGGVVLSDVSKNKPAKAKVLAVGPGRLDRHGNFIKPKVKEGDIVIIDPFLPRGIQVDGKEYLVVRAGEVFAKQT